MKLKRKNPCKECPFRKGATPGWLGPWTPQSILQQAFSDQQGGLACHLHAGQLLKKDRDISDEDLYNKVHVCVGSLQCANVSAKSYWHPDLSKWAKLVGTSNLIMGLIDFFKHHTEGLKIKGPK